MTDTPRTVGAVLAGSAADLERALRDGGVARTALAGVGGLAAAAYSLADERVAESLLGMLDIDLGGLLATGWCRYRDLVEAGERTRDTPGPPEDVMLVEHEITSEHHPSVDVLVNGTLVTTLTFDVTVALRVRSLVAVVDAGAITALRTGDVHVGAVLELHGQQLLARDVRCVVGALVPLGQRIALVSPASASAPAVDNRPWWQRTAGN